MVTTLYLIRHGETAGGETKRYKGSIDVPLSEKGIDQMRKTSSFVARSVALSAFSFAASYLRDVHGSSMSEPTTDGHISRISAVYCSDLVRAVKSAEIIAEPHRLNPVPLISLRERSFGRWEGMSFTEIREQYPMEFENWAANPLKHSPPEGESTIAVAERAVSTWQRIAEDHRGEQVVIVSHGGVNRVILCHVLGVPLENIFRIEQGYGCINIIELWDRYPVVKLVNGDCIE